MVRGECHNITEIPLLLCRVYKTSTQSDGSVNHTYRTPSLQMPPNAQVSSGIAVDAAQILRISF